jgi:hypothetical protein
MSDVTVIDGMSSQDKLTCVIIGIIVGIVLTLAIVMMLYSTRSSIFYYCPRSIRGCGREDYIQTLDEARVLGYSDSEVTIVKDNKLYYKKQTKKGCNCINEHPLVHIEYPQVCTSSSTGLVYEFDHMKNSSVAIYKDQYGDCHEFGKDCMMIGGEYATPSSN